MSKRTTTARGDRYDVRYRTPAGAVRTRTFRTRQEANRFVATVETDKLRGAWVDPREGARTLAELASLWIASSPSKRTSTLATERSHLRVHILPSLGERPVSSITRRDVQALVNVWSARLSPRTVRRVFGTLAAILNDAVDNEVLVRSPCRGVKLPHASSTDRRLPTVPELEALAEALGPDFAPLVFVGAVLGLRWGECAGLRVGRVDFIRSTLTVAEQITRGAHGEPTRDHRNPTPGSAR